MNNIGENISGLKKIFEDTPIFKPAGPEVIKARAAEIAKLPIKKYRVDVEYVVAGSVTVEAHSADEAQQIVYDKLDYSGLDEFPDIDYSNREFDATNAVEA